MLFPAPCLQYPRLDPLCLEIGVKMQMPDFRPLYGQITNVEVCAGGR